MSLSFGRCNAEFSLFSLCGIGYRQHHKIQEKGERKGGEGNETWQLGGAKSNYQRIEIESGGLGPRPEPYAICILQQ